MRWEHASKVKTDKTPNSRIILLDFIPSSFQTNYVNGYCVSFYSRIIAANSKNIRYQMNVVMSIRRDIINDSVKAGSKNHWCEDGRKGLACNLPEQAKTPIR
jgi:hypothetical protein